MPEKIEPISQVLYVPIDGCDNEPQWDSASPNADDMNDGDRVAIYTFSGYGRAKVTVQAERIATMPNEAKPETETADPAASSDARKLVNRPLRDVCADMLDAFGVMFGDVETVTTPLGVPLRIGDIRRNAEAALTAT